MGITKMRVLQIGSGSMGSRRMRDLVNRNDIEIALLEPQKTRQQVAMEKFNVRCFSTLEGALQWQPHSIIISSPPQTHSQYVRLALDQGLNFFCEAELFPYDFVEVEKVTKSKQIVAAPSCTLLFLPIVSELAKIVQQDLGNIHAFSYCLSADLASWHPEEGKEYYARNRSTNGTREMVGFELVALTQVFGSPVNASGLIRQGGELGHGFEDTWCIQMRLENGGIGHMQILGGSPQSVRRGEVIGANGSIEFDLITGKIRRRLPKIKVDDELSFKIDFESVYKEEISTFIDAINHSAKWPHDYRKACLLSGTLAAAEKSAVTGRVVIVDPNILPAQFPDQY